MRLNDRSLSLLALFVAIALLGGCTAESTQNVSPKKEGPKDKSEVGKSKEKSSPGQAKIDDHSGWWCDEHGLPEDICDLCSRKFREAEKAKGNWCEHGRVKSSCFKCDLSLKDRLAKEYEARFSKKPPPIDDAEETGKEVKK